MFYIPNLIRKHLNNSNNIAKHLHKHSIVTGKSPSHQNLQNTKKMRTIIAHHLAGPLHCQAVHSRT